MAEEEERAPPQARISARGPPGRVRAVADVTHGACSPAVTTDLGLLRAVCAEVLRANQGLAHLQRFLEAGLSRTDVGRARHLGFVNRPRIGWYLEPAAPQAAEEAVRVGGLLGCVSAAESYGMTVPEHRDGRHHVSLPPDATRLRRSTDAARHVHAGEDGRVRLHWEQRIEPPRGWRVSPADALAQLAACTSLRWLIAAVDSARNATYAPAIMDAGSLPVLRAALPDRLLDAVDRSDPLAESSGETFIRLEAQDRRIPIVSQVWLTQLYRTDHQVDSWLPIESDGIKNHSGKAVERDRGRDAVLSYLGPSPLRFTQSMAVRETAFVGDVIERVWRRGPGR